MTELRDFHVAQNSEDSEELTRLSYSPDPTIRSYVAENPHTNLNVLKRMTQDVVPHVCIYILRNPKVSNEMCQELAGHTDKMVRREAMILAIRRYKNGTFDLSQKDLFSYIKYLDVTANNLDAIEALVEINEVNDGAKRA